MRTQRIYHRKERDLPLLHCAHHPREGASLRLRLVLAKLLHVRQDGNPGLAVLLKIPGCRSACSKPYRPWIAGRVTRDMRVENWGEGALDKGKAGG